MLFFSSNLYKTSPFITDYPKKEQENETETVTTLLPQPESQQILGARKMQNSQRNLHSPAVE